MKYLLLVYSEEKKLESVADRECFAVELFQAARDGVLVAGTGSAQVRVPVFDVLGEFFDDIDLIHGAEVESGQTMPDDVPPIRHCRAR